MHLSYRNCNDAFYGLVNGVFTGKIPTEVVPSRYGEVAMIEEPVIITYEKPTERVLFNLARDANPFFHLYESLWMLAGRNDVEPLAFYNKRMREFSDDGKTFNGAYGYRWRSADNSGPTYYNRIDQIKLIIDHLKNKPESRRAVLQMWNAEDDLLKIDSSRDVCCNLSACFSIERGPVNGEHEQPRYLNMTIFNRSNDLIWGMLGANVVHFSFLQEYIASHLGLEVGKYHQVSNNLHVYTANWKPEEWLREYDANLAYTGYGEPYPLIKDPKQFDEELPNFVDRFCGENKVEDLAENWDEPFLQEVAQPLLIAFACHKVKDYHGAFAGVRQIVAADWRIAAQNWLEKRSKTHAK